LLTFKITLQHEQQIIFYENHFIDFFKNKMESQEKIKYVLELIKQVERFGEIFKTFEQMDFMKLELNISQIFIEYFAVLTKEN
jgi:hypothetical protein